MKLEEAGGVLALASGFDRFIVLDDLNTASWFSVLRDVDFLAARDAVVSFYSAAWDGKAQLTPRDVLERVQSRIAGDVRSARARGLIDASWDERSPLPGDVREALRRAREGDQVAAAEIAARPAGGNALPQLVTKRVPA